LGYDEKLDQLIQWDVKKGYEITSNYASLNSEIFHDSEGGVYLRNGAYKDMIMNCNQKTYFKCYNVPKITI